jgi:hypothetical protein
LSEPPFFIFAARRAERPVPFVGDCGNCDYATLGGADFARRNKLSNPDRNFLTVAITTPQRMLARRPAMRFSAQLTLACILDLGILMPVKSSLFDSC